MRVPYVVGNWKMHTGPDDSVALAGAVARVAAELAGRVEVGIAPPAVWLERVRRTVGARIHVLGQNCNAHASGAHTGEVSAGMLAAAGADAVILGHSERRHVYGETDADVAAKVAAARGVGLGVILCVGEKLDERDGGRTWEVVRGQLEGGTSAIDSAEGLTVAYEPVWAIGTGRTASPEQAQEVHAAIRSWWGDRFGAEVGATLRIQYGGSVKPSNAAELLGMPDIDGALVGGASLDAEDFASIVGSAVV